MQSKKIILLNAPPGAGKDFAAKYLEQNLTDCKLDKFARVLKERTHALYGFPERDFMYYESCKEEPNEDFLGLTPRQAYINVSETYFKPTHGKRVFGELLLQELKKENTSIIAVSDSGFKEEAEVLIDEYGADNIFLIHILREGCDFSSDSRNYIYPPYCKSCWILNKGDSSFTDRILEVVTEWLEIEDSYFG